MNLPNKLTLTRIILVPVFMVFVSLTQIGTEDFNPAWYLVAGIIFAAASFTDFLDGHLARKWNMVTDFGKFADPLADKLLTTVAFIYMMRDGVCSPVVLCIILPSRKIFQGPTLRTYSAIRTGQSDRPSHGNHQPESRNLKRGNKQNNQRNQTHSLLFFTGRKTVRIHLQPCHPIRFQTSKDGHGEYPEKSSPEPLSVL